MEALLDAIRRGEEGDFHDAFGNLTRVSRPCRERIDRIKNNDPDLVELSIQAGVAHHFSELAWRLLGKYVAGNDYLESIHVRTPLLNDATVTSLFGEELRDGSRSVKKLALTKMAFGIAGTKDLARFLKQSRLTELELRQNEHVLETRAEGQEQCAECFRMILDALDGGPIERLRVEGCAKIDSIAAFERCALPRLRVLNLDQNSIRSLPSLEGCPSLEHLSLEGNWMRRGYPTIANLLRSESPPLKSLDLTFTGMGDTEAELVADALKSNTSLAHLRLEGNKIKDGGRMAFLKLLSDVSSVRATRDSNHTIRSLEMPRSPYLGLIPQFQYIDMAMNVNRACAGNPNMAARTKIAETQLNGAARRELCELQRVEYRYDALIPQIDPVLLPNVLALAGAAHGRSELYRMLLAAVPELASVVDRRTALRERVEDNEARIAGWNADLERERAELRAEYERRLAELTEGNERRTKALADENSRLRGELDSLG